MRPVSLLLGVGALVVAAATGVASPPPPRTVHVTIVHTNDLHGHVENAAAITGVARAARAKNPNTLFLDAGDAITGTPVSTLFRGEPVFEVMTLMGYDAGSIGNHEFDHGFEQIAKFRALAGFPLLNANAKDPDGKPFGDEPSHVFDVGGVRIGVIGLVTDSLPEMTTTANWGGCSVEPPLEVAKRLVPELRKQCDVVVLLTHVGILVDAAIAGAVPGIDLVVGGHSHTILKEPNLVACGAKKVPVVQAFRYGERVGIVEFDWDTATKSVENLAGRLVSIDAATMPNADDVKQLVGQWTAKANAKVDLTEVIGRTKSKLTKAKLQSALERIYADVLGADFGYQNLMGVRADIDAGDIRVESVWQVLPFENTLVKISLKGDEVPKYARTKLGRSFDPDRTYVFATNSYVGDQMKKYLRVEGAPLEDTGISMRQSVVDWVRKHGGFEFDGEPVARDDDEGEPK